MDEEQVFEEKVKKTKTKKASKDKDLETTQPEQKLHIDQELLGKIRTALENKKLIIGNDRIIKALSKLSSIVVSKNVGNEIAKTISRANLEEIEIIKLNVDSSDLSIACKKQFPVSIIGFLKWKNTLK